MAFLPPTQGSLPRRIFAKPQLGRYRKLPLLPSPLLTCFWRSASISSNTRNSSSVMSASVIVSPMLFAFKKRKHRRTRVPFGVSIASSSRFLGQPEPWLTSMAFQSARQAGQPSNSLCAEYPHRRQRKTRSGQSSSAPHSPPWCSTDRIRKRTPGSSGQSPGAAIPGLRQPRWQVAR